MHSLMASGDIETEIKLAVSDPQAVQTLLAARGFNVIKPRVFESNTVFDTPAQALRSAGRLLRLRAVGAECILTFKGPAPALEARHKTREELEIHVSNTARAAQILDRLGYHPTFRYEKYRTEFARASDEGIVTLDETPIGSFIELEGPPAWIDQTATDLGFDDSQYITVSYGELYLRHCDCTGEKPSHMVFNPTFCE